jgi:CubicO group peptidase (beta-lactamase class C family)
MTTDADPARPRTADVTARLRTELEAGVERVARAEDFSGVVRVTRGRDVVLERAYGVASRRWGVPVAVTTRFDTASVTKLFTAVAVLQQVDAGTLDLDASIGTWVPLAGTEISEAVTLRHLLTHTSGLADDADEEAGESYEELWVDRPNYAVTTTADFLPQFAHKPARVEPGTDCRYCNVGYVLAGLALEAVTGQTYREYVVEHVFGPAGMDRAGFFDMREAEPDVAEGWEPVRDAAGDVTGWRQNIYSYPPIGSPDGGAHVSARDLTTFLDAVRSGRLLSAESTRAFFTPQALHHEEEGGSVHFGFGLEIEVLPDGSVRSFGKDGINTGASAYVRWYPALDVTVALVSNAEGGVWSPMAEIDAVVMAVTADE